MDSFAPRDTGPAPGVPPYRRSLPLRLLDGLAWAFDRMIGWWRFPKILGVAVLIGLRGRMRRKNLIDNGAGRLPVAWNPRYRTERSPDGSYNDLDNPRMGMAGSPFGRNMAPVPPATDDDVLEPSPREISRVLLTRHRFKAATTINALSAAWLQFMVRDWFHHRRGTDADVWEELGIPRIPRDEGEDAYANINSHGWDGSQLYGNDRATQDRVRSHHRGRLVEPRRGALPPQTGEEPPAVDPGYWLGVAMLQLLFIREHNAICDRLHTEYPEWTDEDLFQRARLINAALIAKIHIVEWTPALIARRTTVAGMSAIWYGILGRRIYRLFHRRLFRNPTLSGIVGSRTRHFGVPFSITEEFSAVYRMHSLIADDWTFHSADRPGDPCTVEFGELTGSGAEKYLREYPLDELVYSFGVACAGQLTLGNFPRSLQELKLPGATVDLAERDILRLRELGLPRYNEFRRRLGLKPVRSITKLTRDPHWAAELTRIYGGDVEKVDLLVGLLAERKPTRFAFGDTTFRIFLLMASRRLNSDRFFTDDYRAEIYTRAGLDWIEENTMLSVLRRHLPELDSVLSTQRNAFTPFRPGAPYEPESPR